MAITAPPTDATHVILAGLACANDRCACQRAVADGEGTTHCPSHGDSSPSLSVKPPDRTTWPLVHCFAGCDHKTVLSALRDCGLLPRKVSFSVNGARHYRRDGAGEDKEVWWDRGAKPAAALYRAEALAGIGPGDVVLVCEGEATTEAAVALGFEAVGTACGASSAPTDDALRPLTGFDVVLCPDNDAPGRAHMEHVARRLAHLGIACRWLEIPNLPEKGDIADFQGGSELLAELIAKAPSAGLSPVPTGTAPTEPLPSFPPTDAGNGELFAHLFGDQVRYDWKRGRWLVWMNHRWATDPDGELFRLAKEAARRVYADAALQEDSKLREMLARRGLTLEQRRVADNMLDRARSERPIADDGSTWDSNPWLVGVANGVVDIRTGGLREGRRDDMVTKIIPIAYDPAAPAERWIAFLGEVFDGDSEVVDFIHAAVGYSLSGSMREHILPVCYGAGANGKSTFLNVIRRLAGDYGGNIPFATIELTGYNNIPADVASMAGLRLVTSSETGEMTRLNTARIKALTGGDPQTARFMRENYFTFQPTAKIWLAVNHLPRIDDTSDGMWRRLRVIPFRRKFEGADRDNDMEPKLMEELPGILAWAIRGAVRWNRDGLPTPRAVMLATNNYRQASDIVREFIADCCIVDPEASVRAGELFSGYEVWARAEGYRDREILSGTLFGRRIGERFTSAHGRRGKRYVGIRLRNDHDGDGFAQSDGFDGTFGLSSSYRSFAGVNPEYPSNPSHPSPDSNSHIEGQEVLEW